MTDLESRLLDLALQRGILTHDDLAPLTQGAEEELGSIQWGPRITALLKRGRLRAETLQTLFGDLLQDSTEASWRLEEELPSAGLNWQGYRELQLIGAGGHARVYKAWDPQMERWVALKFPNPERAQRVAHLLREARAQARVDHPHVLKVLEVGEHKGRPFIALHLVEGGNLGTVWSQFSLEVKIRLMQRVAEGLQAAHALGLLHLDIKPGNILVDTTHPDEPWPFLTDFGLVRRESAENGTLEDMPAFGTPPFASPEQMAGDLAHLDRRSDVYSLGATLYAVLAGKPPFDTRDPIELLSAEPVPLRERAPMVPEDLQAITEKCLRRDPRERYPSAKAVAEELQRFLDGVPIEARHPSLTYRLGKWVRRNRHLAGLGLIAFVLLAGLGAWSLREAQRNALQVRLADRYGRDVQSMDQLLRLAHLSRKHDRRPAVARARDTMARIRRDMQALGDTAFGPGSYALGMGHLALGEWEAARKHLDAAWDSPFRIPACAQARGEVLTHFYRKAFPKLNLLAAGEPREKERQRLYQTLRDPALACFGIARQAGLETAYQEAMEAYLAGDLDRTFRRAEAAGIQTPWRYETAFLRADVVMEMSTLLHAAGDTGAAQRKLEESRSILEPVLEIAPSDPESWVRAGLLYFNTAFDRRNEHQWLERSQRCFETATQVDPEHGESFGHLSMVLGAAAEAAELRGEDPIPLLNRCVAMGERSQALTPPGQPNAHLGEALGWRAGARLQRGLDAIPDLDRGIASLRQAVELGSQNHVTYTILHTLCQWRGEAAFQVGENPIPYLEQAVQWAQANTQFDPANLRRRKALVERRLDLLEQENRRQRARPGVAEELVQAAQELLDRTAQENQFKAQLRVVLGRALRARAREGMGTKESNRKDLEIALELTERAILRDPKEPNFQAELAYTCLEATHHWSGSASEGVLRRGLTAALAYQRLVPVRAAAAALPTILRLCLARNQGHGTEAQRLERELDQRMAKHPLEGPRIRALLER